MFDIFKDEKKKYTKKLSQFYKAKYLLELKLLVKWDYEQLLRQFFLCFGGQKNVSKNCFKNLSVLNKHLHEIKLKKYIHFFLNFIMNFKKEFSPAVPLLLIQCSITYTQVGPKFSEGVRLRLQHCLVPLRRKSFFRATEHIFQFII